MKKASLLIAPMLLPVFLGVGSSRPSQPQESDFTDLTLEVSRPKEEFVQLEPITLTISLSNKTDQPILAHGLLGFSDNHIRLFVNPVGEEPRRILNLSVAHESIAPTPQAIRPGQTFEKRQLMDIELDKIFPYAGEYQLRAEFLDVGGKKTIKSNQLRVRILEPAGKDREASDFIRSHGNPSSFLTGYEFAVGESPLSVLEDFVARFGNTSYGDYAVFQLSKHYLFKKEFGKTIELLENLEKKTGFIFTDEVKKDIEKAREKLKKTAEGN